MTLTPTLRPLSRFSLFQGFCRATAYATGTANAIAGASAVVLFFAGPACAGSSIVGTGATGGMSPTTATALQVNRAGGAGHIAIVPYFSTQRGNTTLLNLTNTDTASGKVVKVRFRSAVNADSVYDFTVLLGPADVWAANISQGADGRSTLTTSDLSCTLPRSVAGPFVTDRLPLAALTAAQRAEWTREGYIEIITVADIKRVSGGSTNPLGDATVNTSAGAACGEALRVLAVNPSNEYAAASAGLDTPSAGLMVSSILINVAGASVAWTTPTTAITAVDGAGNPARGRMVLSPQTADPAPGSDLYTNDPLLRSVAGGGSGKLAAKQLDLPDLSTPYVGTSANAVDLPFRYVESVAALLAVKKLRNEFLTDPSINARTDWTLTQPLRRFAFGVDYSASPYAAVSNNGVAGPSSYYTYIPFSVMNNGCFAAYTEFPLSPYNRLGSFLGPDFTTATEGIIGGCYGAASIVDFGSLDTGVSSVLQNSLSTFAARSRFGKSVPPKEDISGWAELRLSQVITLGVPAVGAAYIQATGPQVAGKSTNFGVLYNHDVGR